MARWIRVATTEESTPPERAQITFPVAYLLLDAANAFFDKIADSPVAPAAADPVNEILQDIFAFRGVDYFRMELQTVDTLIVAHNGDGVFSV